MKDIKEKKHPIINNLVCEKEGFFVSYNPNRNINLAGEPETAICIPRKDNKRNDYFILNGNFRKEYDGKNIKESLRYFLKKSDDGYIAFWSQSTEEALEILKNI